MTSKLWDVEDALVSLFEATVDVPVLDGPPAQKTMPKRFVLVGSDGGETGTGEGIHNDAEAAQTWAALNQNPREERGEVMCAVWAWSGGTDISALRTSVRELVDPIEAAVHANRKHASVAPGGWMEFGRLSHWSAQLPGGAAYRASFVISYLSRLT